ncbi:MAG: isopeptide-forming domain-containing fimbrial protein [Deltaproteobacteria bacterium]|nr:isopeptide-forming domain-containing fimbrial protein [Deltaproteobacteria bacterium]
MLRHSFVPRTAVWLLVGAGALVVAPATAETPTLRWQGDLRGDVRIFGNTLAYDCHSPVPPSPAAVSCAGQTNTADTAPDLYWRDDMADATVLPSEARTSATLELPSGAKVVYARLYWAALKEGADPDTTAVLDWIYASTTQTITADSTNVVPHPYNAQHPTWYLYQASGDATDYVSKWGAGDFRVTGVDAIPLANQDIDVAFSAWTLVVFYENQTDDLRNLALFDGLFYVDPPSQGSLVESTVNLSGFLVPPNGYSAKMAAFVYEGDHEYTGDAFAMNGTKVTNGLNPVDNFFNSSRTDLGSAVSGSQDVPKLTGQPDTMAGYDLDMVDVTANVKAGDTEATVTASSTYDKFYIGGFVTSLTNKAADFNDLTKTVVDVNGGAVLPNDILEYTISGTNKGNDDAVNVRITDTLDPGLELVAGSLEIVQGGAIGLKTNQPGDDEADYDNASRTATWRVGTGATATLGGTVGINAPVKVRFKAKVTAQKGTIKNKAILKGTGASGGVEKTWETDSDPNTVGKQTTDITINECSTNADCKEPNKPHCDPTTHVCMACVDDNDCLDPNKPACQPSGACGECSKTNKNKCDFAKPECNTDVGVCVLCIPGPDVAPACKGSLDGPMCISLNANTFCGCTKDSDCGSVTSGKVCDSKVSKCIDGCRGKGGNGCQIEKECTSQDTTIGKCVDPQPDSGAGGGGLGGSGGGGTQYTPPDSKDEGGCACSTPGHRDLGAAGLALAMLGIGSALARRRRK